MTYAEMEAELFARARHGMRLGLDRMERTLDALGRPDKCAPVFHVAGTNGKGSICAMLDAGVRAAGLRCGLYTSPHLEHFSERFRVNGDPIAEADLLALYTELRDRVPSAFDGDEALTFFEVVTLLGFVHFARSKVDVMVVEVGLGGRLDATNVLTPAVACIASIGLEHREYLGDTVGEIATEKAGILKPNCPAVIARQSPEALEAILARARVVGAPVSVEGRDFTLGANVVVGLRGRHQLTNAAVALRAMSVGRERGIPVSQTHALDGIATAQWPGRLETVAHNPEIVLDGAHNPPATAALADACRELFPGRRIHLVLGVLADKQVSPMIDALTPIAVRAIATSPVSPRALPARELAHAITGLPVEVIDSPDDAVAHAVRTSGRDDVILVCGSLYLVGEIRAHLHGKHASGPGEILARPAFSI